MSQHRKFHKRKKEDMMHKCVKHVWKDMLHWLYYLSMRLVTFPKKLCVLHKCCRNVIFFLKKIRFQKLTIWSMRDYPFLKLGYLTRKFRRQQGHAYWKHNALWNAETKAFREAKSCFAFSTLGTHFFSFFSFVIWAWLLTSLRLKWGEKKGTSEGQHQTYKAKWHQK